MYDRARSFRRQALVPVFGCQSPANFHARCKFGFKRWDGEANVADERMLAEKFRRVQPKAVNTNMALDFLEQLVALFPRKGARQEFHDPQVAIQVRESPSVGIRPTAQEQPFRPQRDHGRLRCHDKFRAPEYTSRAFPVSPRSIRPMRKNFSRRRFRSASASFTNSEGTRRIIPTPRLKD